MTTDQHFIWFFNLPNAGKIWVRAGKFDLGDSKVPDAEFVDALESLQRRSYIRHSDGNVYVLTGSGLKAAKRFAAKISLQQIPSEQNDGNSGKKRQLPGVGASVG